jgi:uncharacterized protein (UPF0332 family)
MKILTDNKYSGTLERKIAITLNQNMIQAEDGEYISTKKTIDDLTEEIARSVRRFQSETDEAMNEN